MTKQLMVDDTITPVALVDPSTGISINPSDPSPVAPYSTLLSGTGYWTIPLSGFVNPRYIAADPTSGVGWSVAGTGYSVVDFSATTSYAGMNVTVQQTADPTGLTDWVSCQWFPGQVLTSSWQIGASTSTTFVGPGTRLIIPTVGQRCRILVTALTTADMNARVATFGIPLPAPFVDVRAQGTNSPGFAFAGNVLMSGAVLKTTPLQLTDGLGHYLQGTESAALITEKHSAGVNGWSYAAPSGGIAGSSAGVTAKASAGTGLRNYIDSMQLSWGTLSAATDFQIRDGASGTVLARFALPTVAGSINVVFDKPLRGTAATLVEIAQSGTVTGGILCNLQGHAAA